MIELAGGLGYSAGTASLTGPAHNPWNPACWTCGSSSGSGAIVSSGLAPWALGSDTRGSILCPSAWCGISGLRPSFGRVSRQGSMAIADSMDKLGPMARTADDCATVLSIISGHDPLDPQSISTGDLPLLPKDTDPSQGPPLRIGVLTNAYRQTDPEGDKAMQAAQHAFARAGTQVQPCALPDGPYEEAAELTILMEAASAFSGLIRSGECRQLTDPVGQINGYASEQFTATDYLHVQRVREILQNMVDAMFDRFDVLISLAQPTAAQPLLAVDPEGDEGDFRLNRCAPDSVSSLCGLPAISVPCGFSSKQLPFGMQIMGRALEDATVLRAALLYQSGTDWHLRHPVM